MSRRLSFVIAAFTVMAALPRPAQATSFGIGIQGGLYTPTGDAKNLVDSQWQVGARFLLPPISPIGVLRVPGLMLDVGFDLSLAEAKQLTAENFDTKQLNMTAVYRYTIPLGTSFAAYVGLGGRVTAVWGEMSQQLREGNLFEHLRGAMSIAGGLDYMITPGIALDARVGYGLFGMTSWEATGGLLLML